MKHLLYIFISVIIVSLSSCDKRKDYFQGIAVENNMAPEFAIRKYGLGGNYTQTVADSLWTNVQGLKIEYTIKDEADDKDEFSSSVLQGSGTVKFIDSLKQVTFTALGMNKNIFLLTATDKFGKTATCTVEVVCFPNRAPAAKLTVTQINQASQREIKISTNLSTDPDMPYGDSFKEYFYRIGPTYSVTTPYNSINYIAASTGTVMVYLKVKDSLGAQSTTDSVKFTIN